MLDTLNTPLKTRLYNTIAKDYLPKQAEMMICKYIEEMEARIEAMLTALERESAAEEDTAKVAKKSKTAKQKAEE